MAPPADEAMAPPAPLLCPSCSGAGSLGCCPPLCLPPQPPLPSAWSRGAILPTLGLTEGGWQASEGSSGPARVRVVMPVVPLPTRGQCPGSWGWGEPPRGR